MRSVDGAYHSLTSVAIGWENGFCSVHWTLHLLLIYGLKQGKMQELPTGDLLENGRGTSMVPVEGMSFAYYFCYSLSREGLLVES